jgi:hypothetical protein
MTDQQRELLYVAYYALDRVINVPSPGDFPDSLTRACMAALNEIEEALPVGSLGPDVPTFMLTNRDAHAYRETDARKILEDILSAWRWHNR